jgi:hypothetical protein
MSKAAALKSSNPALYNFVEAELEARFIELDSEEAGKVFTAIEERTALVMQLRDLDADPIYSNFPVGSQGYKLLAAKKDGLLKAIVEQECVLANFGLV